MSKYMLFSLFFFVFSFVLLIFSLFFLNSFSLLVEIFFPSIFFDFSMKFCIDFISVFFFCCVSMISSVVFFYSIFYMSVNWNFTNSDNFRFMYMLFFFIVSMFFLVFSYSWFMVMLGWDGLGITSFLLVIYYNNSKSLDSGMVTVLTNRLGDCFFLLSFSFMIYLGVFSFDFMMDYTVFMFLMVMMLGSITKSAQMPFSSWLPAAMAAPTPVSSLVHSSTLVTAGVFLLIRFNFLFKDIYFLLSIISLITMTLAGLFAVYELDFKKIIAMSTLSQLGFMIFSISMKMWMLCFIHMIFHAFFKSSLFMATGSLMHSLNGNQDSRLFSSFYFSFFSKLYFSLSCLSLMGFPFSLGFYSKDLILGNLLFLGNSLFIVILFSISCCFTVAYSLRILNLGFLGFNSFDFSNSSSEEKNFFIPVMILFLVTLFIGNFYGFYFLTFSMIFSWVELFLGIFIILGGFYFLKMFNISFKTSFFLKSMMNLPLFISFLSLKVVNKKMFLSDFTWMEDVTSKMIKKIIFVNSKFIDFLFKLDFFYFGLLCFYMIIMLSF